MSWAFNESDTEEQALEDEAWKRIHDPYVNGQSVADLHGGDPRSMFHLGWVNAATGRRPLNEEMERARAKYPGNEDRILALSGELVELLSAILHAKARGDWQAVKGEALQVAACAMRLYEEGDASETAGDRLAEK